MTIVKGQFYTTPQAPLDRSTEVSMTMTEDRALRVAVTNLVTGDATAANQELEIAQLQNANDSLNAIEADIDTIRNDVIILKNKDFATATKQDEQTAILTGIDNSAAFLPYVATEATLLETNNKIDSTNIQLNSIDNTVGIQLPAIASSASNIDSKTPALGQALAAGSVPVVLTAAQLTTLTPPAAITGFATEAKQDFQINQLYALDSINTNTVPISDIVDNTQNIDDKVFVTNEKLTTLNAKDFATSAKQDTSNSYLLSVDNHLSTIEANSFDASSYLFSIDSKLNSQATAANQGSANISLASIDGKLILPSSLGQKPMATSLSVAIASDQNVLATSALQTTGNNSLSSIATSTGTMDTNIASIRSTITAMNAKLPATLGQKTMANSLAVTIASDQDVLATSAKQDSQTTLLTNMDFYTTSIAGYLNTISSAQLPSSLGQKNAAGSLPVVIASNNTVTVDTELVAAATIGDGENGTLAITQLQARLSGYNGTNYDRLRTGASVATATPTGYLDTIVFGKYNSSPVTLTNGQLAPHQLDSVGATYVNTLTAEPILFRNTAANATLNIKSTAGRVYSCQCRNLNAAIRYFQLWNTSTVAGTGSLIAEFTIPATSITTIDGGFFTVRGLPFSTGIAFGFSTTSGSYTAGTAADQMSMVVYS